MSDLLSVLNECPDYKDMSIIQDLPYKDEILNNTFTLDDKTLEELLLSLKTFSYLGVDSTEVVKEIVWIIGKDDDLFHKYFTDTKNFYHVRSDIDKITLCEFKRVYPEEYYLEQLRYRGGKYSTFICNIAYFGDFRLLKWALDEYNDDFDFDSDVFYMTALGGHIDILKWIIENYEEKEFDRNIIIGVIKSGKCNVGILEWLYTEKYKLSEEALNEAVKICNIEIVKWLVSKKCPMDRELSVYAIEYFNDIEILKWLRSEGCELSTHTMNRAIRKNNFEIIKWLRSEGCQWEDKYTFGLAIDQCDFEILKWMKRNGCQINNSSMMSAILKQRFEIVKWLDCHILCSAFMNGLLLDHEIFKWLILNRQCASRSCECYRLCETAARNGYYDIVKWLILESGKEYQVNYIEFSESNMHNYYDIYNFLKNNNYNPKMDINYAYYALQNNDYEPLKYAIMEGNIFSPNEDILRKICKFEREKYLECVIDFIKSLKKIE